MTEADKLSHWQKETIYPEGDEYFREVYASLDQAEHEIHIESYIFNLDPIGIEILDKLQKAAHRGVIVRLLVDGIGSYNFLGPLQAECKKRNIQFRIYHPLPFKIKSLQKMSWKRINMWIQLFRRINKRNHRKIILIDQKFAFLGSYNITQVHSKRWMGGKAWRDMGVLVQGTDILLLAKNCLDTWNKAKLRNLKHLGLYLKPKIKFRISSLLRINSNLRVRFFLLRDLIKRMSRSEKQILITNAYFLPKRSVLRALKSAARRGIYVGLCIPAVSDIWFVKAAARSLYYRLLKSGVHIFEYQKTVLHSKTLVIDDWGTIGSHNLNHRSLQHDLEIEAVITYPENIHLLNCRWHEDIKNSKEITLKDLGSFTLWSRIISRFAYWFRYWI